MHPPGQPEGPPPQEPPQRPALDGARERTKDLAARAKTDPGVAFEPGMLEDLLRLQLGDPPTWVRLRVALGDAGVPLRELDRAMKDTRERLVQGAQPQVPPPEDIFGALGAQGARRDGGQRGQAGGPDDPAAARYVVQGGVLCLLSGHRNPLRDLLGLDAEFARVEMQADGAAEPLCSFNAWIAAEETRDDGAEQTRVLVLEGSLRGGDLLPAVRVAAERFSSLSWVASGWGARAVIYVGPSFTQHVRAAIQLLSPAPVRRTVYTHLGWREIDGLGRVYLQARGAIGAEGPVEEIAVDLPDELQHFILPQPPQGAALVAAMRASLKLLDGLAPDGVMIPLYAAIWRAALGDADFGEHVAGKTGERKTALATLAQQHYGAAMDALHLPAGWQSTANALEMLSFSAKDAVLVVDDFTPTGGAGEVGDLHGKAERLFRGTANRTGRGRMRPDGTLRPAKRPRALIVSTGEDTPQGHSLRARLLVLEHAPNTVDLDRLTACQAHAAAGDYAAAMAGFVQWLAGGEGAEAGGGGYVAMHQRLRAEGSTRARQIARPGMHARTAQIAAQLGVALDIFADFAVAVGALDPAEADALGTRTWAALQQVAEAQREPQAASDPARQFVAHLGAAITSGLAHVATRQGDAPTSRPGSWGWRQQRAQAPAGAAAPAGAWEPQGSRVGWLVGEALYLDPEVAFAIVQQMGQRTGQRIAVTLHTLHRRLHEQGVLVSTDERRRTLTVRRLLGGHLRNVLHVRAGTLFHVSGN